MTALMFQGTASNVGKSTLVAGLCRALKKRDIDVLPFKPLNMSNNAAATPCGGEIGRAQALQALACGVAPSVDMNPILLKPQSAGKSQLVMRGRAQFSGEVVSSDFTQDALLEVAIESFSKLKKQADIILVEGAGSAAEVNLRGQDIANMAFACATETPVVMVGDIELGGVIASLVGTCNLLHKNENDLIKGFIINKFRGDPSLFQGGIEAIVERTSWPSFGIVPYLRAAVDLPAEDAAELDRFTTHSTGIFTIAVPHMPHIANFDDLDPLRQDPSVQVQFIPPGQPLPAHADLVFLPGSKSTLLDLAFLKNEGWDIDLRAHVRRGGHILGVCGGFQMLGREISDPTGIEGMVGAYEGLGLLNINTEMLPEKQVGLISGASHILGCDFEGYEIHIGTSQGPDVGREFISSCGRSLGASAYEGRVLGTYLHGVFANDNFRRAYLRHISAPVTGQFSYARHIENVLDELADHLEEHIDIDGMLRGLPL